MMLSSNETRGGYPCIACRRNLDAPRLGGVCPTCERICDEWDNPPDPTKRKKPMDTAGWYDKFDVRRKDTGEEVTEAKFTLLPDHDPHARIALGAYAESIKDDAPDLHADITAYLNGAA